MAKKSRQPLLPGMEADADTADSEKTMRTKHGEATSSPEYAKRDHSPLTTHHSPTITPHSTITNHQSPLTTHRSPTSLVNQTVYCIDANSLIFQVFHAIPEMTSPKGEPVNAVFGFTRDILFLLEQRKPDYLLCAFDLAEPTFRDKLYEQYKATRSAMPDDLSPQFPMIVQMLECLNVPVLTWPGYEADDILATIARITEEHGGECFLVSGDKDCRQLLSERVKIFNVRKNQVFDVAALAAEWGVRPEQVVDFQAIVGDSVDNIPGIPGIGPKGAQQLLTQYGTLDEVLAHASEIAGAKRKQSLIEGREQALLSRQLVRLERNIPLMPDWGAWRVRGVRRAKTLELFQRLGFHSFAAKVRMMEDLGEAESLVPPEEWRADYRLVNTLEGLAELATQLQKQKRFSLDAETTHIWPAWADLVGMSFCWEPGVGYYVPVCGPPGEQCLDREMVLAALRPALEDPNIEKVGQNLKYDWIVLRQLGIELRGVAFDTMLASYLLESGERNHNLEELAQRYFGHANIKIESLLGTGKDQKRMDQVPLAQVTHYAGEDADVALRLTPLLEKKLAEARLDALFRTLELPLVEVLVELESNGIRIDKVRLAQLSQEFGQRIEQIETQIYDMAGRQFNIGSPKQLQDVLFVENKLPVIRKTKTGPSTDADVLEELGRIHPLPAKIIEYRQFAKLKSTYVDALPAMINPRTGRVHASFNQTVAATGRLSSHDPNLQNIPIRTEEGQKIRSAFLPQEGWWLLAADYSQIELRILAHYSGDATLREAFERDEDIHARVASEVHGVPLTEVTAEMRRQAKAVNFGIVYGQSPFGLSRQLGIDKKEAEQFIDAYFARYPGVEQFLNQVLADCRMSGYVSTILGRRRAIAGIRPGVRRQRNPPERMAINTVIQGSAADLIKAAMLAVHRRLKQEKFSARMLLQIHDELVFEVPSDEVETLAALVAQEMTHVMRLHAPIKVDVKTGRSLAEV